MESMLRGPRCNFSVQTRCLGADHAAYIPLRSAAWEGVMATIDFGYLSDLNCDIGTTTTVVIPDDGLLPELPPAVAEEFSAAAVRPVPPPWGGRRQGGAVLRSTS